MYERHELIIVVFFMLVYSCKSNFYQTRVSNSKAVDIPKHLLHTTHKYVYLYDTLHKVMKYASIYVCMYVDANVM